MSKTYQENTTASPIWVCGVMIPPGEGREVEVPDDAPAAPAPEPEVDPDDALRELLGGTVAQVKAALPGLGEETLKRLQALELAAAAPRKGVAEALGDALIAIADEKLKGEDLSQGDGQGGGQDGGQGEEQQAAA